VLCGGEQHRAVWWGVVVQMSGVEGDVRLVLDGKTSTLDGKTSTLFFLPAPTAAETWGWGSVPALLAHSFRKQYQLFNHISITTCMHLQLGLLHSGCPTLI
jgi:hypothetical protein